MDPSGECEGEWLSDAGPKSCSNTGIEGSDPWAMGAAAATVDLLWKAEGNGATTTTHGHLFNSIKSGFA